VRAGGRRESERERARASERERWREGGRESKRECVSVRVFEREREREEGEGDKVWVWGGELRGDHIANIMLTYAIYGICLMLYLLQCHCYNVYAITDHVASIMLTYAIYVICLMLYQHTTCTL